MSELYIVSTPIGNLGDITLRAVEVLKRVDFIAAEDTRHSRRLLGHLGIDTPLEAYHDQNESKMAPEIVERILAGKSVALISDAGTPLISDPGYRLVRRALEAGITVIPVPGASAVIAALSVSGLPTDRFVFEGFLPAKQAARRASLEALRFENRTLVFYEAPHRIAKTVADMMAVWGGDRKVAIAREMTKKFEQFWNGSLAEASYSLEEGEIPARGEFVIVVEGDTRAYDVLDVDVRRIMQELLTEFPPRKAAELVSRITGQSKRSLYQLALTLKQNTRAPKQNT